MLFPGSFVFSFSLHYACIKFPSSTVKKKSSCYHEEVLDLFVYLMVRFKSDC